MMIRIVQLTFADAHCAAFESLFETLRNDIRHFPGCSHLELWKDRSRPGVYCTYSTWSGPEALDEYRHSDLFAKTWSTIKPWFSGKPEAWSLDRIASANL